MSNRPKECGGWPPPSCVTTAGLARLMDMRSFVFTLLFAASLQAQPIEHLLSRVTFGPTAVERERVEKIGIDRYIDEQLDPASIDDGALDQRLRSLATLRTATPPLLARFNPPRVQLPE